MLANVRLLVARETVEDVVEPVSLTLGAIVAAMVAKAMERATDEDAEGGAAA